MKEFLSPTKTLVALVNILFAKPELAALPGILNSTSAALTAPGSLSLKFLAFPLLPIVKSILAVIFVWSIEIF